MKKFFSYWLPVLIWAIFIFSLSAIPNLKSGLEEDYILRKIAHVLEFMILTLLLFRAIKFSDVDFKKAIVYSFIIALFYAFSDEFHQFFVIGRQCSIKDVGIDSIGIFIAAGLCYIRNRKGRNRNLE